MRAKVIVWSLIATASLVGVAVCGVPLIATRLAPLIPYSLELRLGELIEAQARASLDTRHAGAAFECGNTAKGEARPRRVRQAHEPARNGCRLADSAPSARGAAA